MPEGSQASDPQRRHRGQRYELHAAAEISRNDDQPLRDRIVVVRNSGKNVTKLVRPEKSHVGFRTFDQFASRNSHTVQAQRCLDDEVAFQ